MSFEQSAFADPSDDQPMSHHEPYSQSILSNDFMYEQTLAFHQGSVRSLATLPSGYLMSGSIDTTSKLFVLNNASGLYEFDKELSYHQAFVYAVAPSVTGDGFFTGGKDCKVFKVDLMGNPVQLFEGHESAVNSIHQSFPEEVVTGSWDGTAKIWDVETGKCKQTLPGHSYATTVLTLANGIIITGSQDKKIRLWFKGNLEKEFIAHEDIIRDFTEVPGLGFASCSNDETVKLWTIDGQNIETLRGHSGFVFSLTTLESGEIVSASDDRTVRVWRDHKCAQVINHPRTIWSVTQNHLGDLITGGEDYKIRTFTRDPTRAATGQVAKDYENECVAQEMGEQLDMAKVPSIDKMRNIKAKEGEVRVFKNGNAAEAYCFKEGKWEKIGDVINPNTGAGAATTGAKIYEGDRLFPPGEYDHIFDVDLGDGVMRKLPFDNGSNPLEAADKFIIRESLHKSYVEQISTFIKNQSMPYATSDNASKKGQATGSQQFGGGSSMPGIPQKQSVLPMKKMLFFDQINVDGPKKKLLEFNSELQILTEAELVVLDQLLDLIKNKAFYHSSKCSKQGFDLIKKMLSRFPCDKVFPVLDVYRMFLMHPHSSEHFKVFENGIEYMGYLIGHLRGEGSKDATQLVALRCLVNLFNNNASVFLLKEKRQFIVDNTCSFLFSDNKNIRSAVITLFLNYSILFVDKNDPEGRIQLVSAISELFHKETDAQNYLRLTTCLGNLSVGDGDAREMIQAMGIKVQTSKLEGGDQKTMETIQEIAKELNIRLCCNNNLCNYDSNVENITEINKKNAIQSEDLVLRQRKGNTKGGKGGEEMFQDIDILTDSKKKMQIKNAFQGQEEHKALLQKMAPSTAKLELQVMSSATLTKGTKIVINALGLISHTSLRDNQDGVTYFGRKKCIKSSTNDPNSETTTRKEVVNDFIIPSKNPQTSEQQRGRHFQIRFDIDYSKYFIKDLGIGHGVFVKIEEPIILKDNMIVNVGEAHIVVNILKDTGEDDYDNQQNSDSTRLKLKIFGGPSSGEIYYFKNEGHEIIIGRTPNCDIRIDDKLLSKTQSFIRYIDDQWVLFDGYNNKPSTNGTWLYLNDDYEIYDGMSFKANQTIFLVKIDA